MGEGPSQPLPTHTSHTKNPGQSSTIEGECHLHCTMVVSPALVFCSQDNGFGCSEVTTHSPSAHSELRQHPPPGPAVTAPDSMEIPPLIQGVLDKARKTSTNLLYSYKWNNFLVCPIQGFTIITYFTPNPAHLLALFV